MTLPIAIIFPGQASQYIGMGGDFRRMSPAVEALYQLADAATGLPIGRVSAIGPDEHLTDTRFAQPAVVATSLAALTTLKDAALAAKVVLQPLMCAGHSVGEISALVASGSLDPTAALDFVRWRGAYMAEACDQTNGSMAALIGLAEDVVRTLCSEAAAATGTYAELANLNSPEQIVVAGHRTALQWISEHSRERGARRTTLLNVAGPFHSSAMRSAGDRLHPLVTRLPIGRPVLPIVLNQTAEMTQNPDAIRAELFSQVYSPVRWTDSIQTMWAAGARIFIEVGPGQVLTGLARRTVKGATVLNVQDEASLESTIQELQRLQELE
ncbi:MAG: ACP S-malonyltransferase [Chloroflexota bacterium]